MTDTAVQKFAKFCGWKGPKEGSDPVASAIGFLERNFKVNYDHQHGTAVGKRFDMSTKNHHLKSLGHSPDLVGLFFRSGINSIVQLILSPSLMMWIAWEIKLANTPKLSQ